VLKNNQLILHPYQRKWVNDTSPVKMWLAARQIGKSFAVAMEAVVEALENKCNTLILSSSERQSNEVMQKVLSHTRVLCAINRKAILTRETKEEVVFSNGSRIISLPANPDTARGFAGNVFLDEFAFHRDDEAIWAAMYPAVTRGYKIRVTSTPNGNKNLFALMWHKGEGISRHKTDIYDAKTDGFDVDIDALRQGIYDPDAWAQEYECRFIDDATAYIPYEMIASCEDAGATMELPQRFLLSDKELYLGMDIGRIHDLSVIWIWERIGDVLWTRAVYVMRKAPFSLQQDKLYGFLPYVRRACIDASGIGMQFVEDAKKRYGEKVEGVTFTREIKEDLGVKLKRMMEDKRLRIPVDRAIRDDLHAVRKYVTPAGNVRLDADRTDAGHADRFWAAALGVSATSVQIAPINYIPVSSRSFFVPAPETAYRERYTRNRGAW